MTKKQEQKKFIIKKAKVSLIISGYAVCLISFFMLGFRIVVLLTKGFTGKDWLQYEVIAIACVVSFFGLLKLGAGEKTSSADFPDYKI